jgi:hypothetical protein
VYEFEGMFALSQPESGSVSTHTLSLLFGGTATINNVGYMVSSYTSIVSLEDILTLVSNSYPQTLGSISLVRNIDSDIFIVINVKGTISIANGGTFIPQYIFNNTPGNPYITNKGSYFKIFPIGTSGSNTSIGSWA